MTTVFKQTVLSILLLAQAANVCAFDPVCIEIEYKLDQQVNTDADLSFNQASFFERQYERLCVFTGDAVMRGMIERLEKEGKASNPKYEDLSERAGDAIMRGMIHRLDEAQQDTKNPAAKRVAQVFGEDFARGAIKEAEEQKISEKVGDDFTKGAIDRLDKEGKNHNDPKAERVAHKFGKDAARGAIEEAEEKKISERAGGGFFDGVIKQVKEHKYAVTGGIVVTILSVYGAYWFTKRLYRRWSDNKEAIKDFVKGNAQKLSLDIA